MKDVRAIQTSYKGFRFRSRLEARWAVLFDALGIAWDYEVEGFELAAGWYLPDFWLPQVKMFAEVKPGVPTAAEATLALQLAIDKSPVLFLVGSPAHATYFAIDGAEYNHGQWDAEVVQYDLMDPNRYWQTEGRFFAGDTHLEACGDYDKPRFNDPSLLTPRPGTGHPWFDATRAINASRSARFEHGESA